MPKGKIAIGVSTLGNENFLNHLWRGQEFLYLRAIYNTLLIGDTKKRGKNIGGVARKWSLSPDGLTWTFYLNKGIKFHDGWGELTAEDVKFSFEMTGRPESMFGYGAVYRTSVAKMEIVNPYEIAIHLHKPDVAFPALLTNINSGWGVPIQCKKYVEKVGENEANTHPIGSGSFRMVEHVKGKYMKMEAVPDHWCQTPYFKELTFSIILDEPTRINMLTAGDLDILEISMENMRKVEQAGGWVFSVPRGYDACVKLGGQWPKLATYDPNIPWAQADAEKGRKVRQALNLAVNPQEIVDKVFQGQGEVKPIPYMYPGEPWWNPAWKPRGYDPEGAKKLLTEAGYPDGFKITMALVAYPGRAFAQSMGEAVADMWKKVGIEVECQAIEQAEWKKLTEQKKWNSYAWASSPPTYLEPISFLASLAYSKASICYLMETPELDTLIDAAREEADDAKRAAIEMKIGQYWYDYIPTVTIGDVSLVYGMSKKITKWPRIPSNMYIHNLEYVH